MKNEEYIKYTYKHRKIVIYLAEKYIKEEMVLNQIKKHDIDKLFIYMFYDKKDISKIHRTLSNHHDNEKEKTYTDYVEMVLDWESARYTKSDKPLNAYDTLYKYYPHMESKILPILRKFGIDKSGLEMEEDVLNYAKNIDDSKESIKKELKEYIDGYFS